MRPTGASTNKVEMARKRAKLQVTCAKNKVIDCIKTQDPSICCLQDSLQDERHRIKVTGWEKTFHAKGNDRKTSIVILISDKMDFKIKSIMKGNGIT